ncbi:5-methylcytosine-specific restriction endonuclease McrA [Peribacillus frigoritolerans]|uniref:HNH endonuclease n=1 Tax=Peribacillus frigoritolerans TaxID=450367 RepID=UPI003836B0AE
MIIKMDLSEILLYLNLMKKTKRRPVLDELKMMLYYLDNYEQVKEFYNKLQENKFNPPYKFLTFSLVHFIENYEDCDELKNRIFQNTRRKYSELFMQLIRLSTSKEQAKKIIEEAKEYKSLDENWANYYDSMWQIKKNQEAWRENIRQLGKYNRFSEIYEDFYKMKLNYFGNLSLKQLKETLLENQTNNNNRKVTQTTVYNRSVYIKEFARRVSNGICQLCEKKAPFVDKEGNPFLEVHHIDYLSRGGSDTVENVVAVCPNCHRKLHMLELEEDVKKISVRALENMLD